MLVVLPLRYHTIFETMGYICCFMWELGIGYLGTRSKGGAECRSPKYTAPLAIAERRGNRSSPRTFFKLSHGIYHSYGSWVGRRRVGGGGFGYMFDEHLHPSTITAGPLKLIESTTWSYCPQSSSYNYAKNVWTVQIFYEKRLSKIMENIEKLSSSKIFLMRKLNWKEIYEII